MISAWKPLQIPITSPSLSFKSFSVSSFNTALRNTAAINLAEPSGSSPAEKPPGNMMIWDFLISSLNISTDSRMSEAVRFLNTLCFTSAPARSKAIWQSNSQLLPGNTGMNT